MSNIPIQIGELQQGGQEDTSRHAPRYAEWIQRACRMCVLRVNVGSMLRKMAWRARGAQIGKGTCLPRARVTWPHQVRVGENCILQPDVFFNYDHYWTPGPSIVLGDRVFVGRGVEFNIQGRIVVGEDALIASGCVFVDHDHGMKSQEAMNAQPNLIEPISVGGGAWIGARSIVLKGVSIGAQAVIGAGSVVTKSVPPGEVWCGAPARFIRRASEMAKESLIAEG